MSGLNTPKVAPGQIISTALEDFLRLNAFIYLPDNLKKQAREALKRIIVGYYIYHIGESKLPDSRRTMYDNEREVVVAIINRMQNACKGSGEQLEKSMFTAIQECVVDMGYIFDFRYEPIN